MKAVVKGLLGAIGVIGIVALLLGAPVMLLWNWLMPSIFGLPVITFWQALGLNLLSSILFGKHNNSFNKKS
jgi:hypothetical protein